MLKTEICHQRNWKGQQQHCETAIVQRLSLHETWPTDVVIENCHEERKSHHRRAMQTDQ